MHPVFTRLTIGIKLQNDMYSDMATFLEHHGYAKTIKHQQQVNSLGDQAVSATGTVK